MATLFDIFWFFLKLGAFSFGGPNSHNKLMENELVTRKHILDADTFQRLKKESLSLPGPTSTQLAMKIGFYQKGVLGMVVAGLSFILPSCLLMLVFALYYKELGNGRFKVADPFLYGIRVAIVAVLIYTGFVYCIRYIRDFKLLSIFLVVLAATLSGLNPVLLLLLSGCAYALLRQMSAGKRSVLAIILQSQPQILLPLLENQKLLLLFVKIGSLMLGSSYIIFAFLKFDLVDTHIITLNTLLDSIAFGLFVPGPIFSVVTFIGYQLSSWQGALLALVGMLIPTMLYAFLGSTVLSRFLDSTVWRTFFRGLIVASLGILCAASFIIGYETLVNYRQWIIFVICLLILIKWPKLNLLWIIIISANLGYLILHFLPVPAN